LALRITDATGNTVRTLQIEPWAEAGIQRVVWNLRDDERQPVEPREYTVTLEADGASQTVTVRVESPVILPRG
jgi:flagellar hook assembly protein FlgD